MADLVDIASAVRDPDTNTLKVSAKSSPVGDTDDDAPGFDDAPIFGTLGVAAYPWPGDSTGKAQALVEEGLGGQNGVVTNIRDLRTAGVVEELGPGETAIYATGPGFHSRVFLKKQSFSAMVGDDCAVVMDRENKRFSISCFGMHFEMSEENGVVVSTGGATSQWKGNVQSHMGTLVLGGRSPLFPLAQMMVPGLVGVAPMSPIVGIAQAPGVFIGV
jgi:hypothetical protein